MPFQFTIYSLVIVWYALHGHHRDDPAQRRAAQPWYWHKREPAFEDMLVKLRRTLVATRIIGVAAAQPDPTKYRDYELARAAAAALLRKSRQLAFDKIRQASLGIPAVMIRELDALTVILE